MGLASILLLSLAAIIAYMSAWFLLGKRLGRIDVADTAWGGGFIVIATICLLSHTYNRSILMWVLITIWGARLALHIWRRNAFKGPDKRYEELSAKWRKDKFWLKAYVSVFLLQAILIYVIALPVMIASGEHTKPLGVLNFIGVVLWVLGFIFEVTADRQLSGFLQTPDNKGQIMTTGLWKYSRHPNYFGELLQWWAIWVITLGPAIGWIGLLGPVLLTYLILFVSGIPPIEKRHSKKPGYDEYKRRTSVIIPLPPRS